MTNADDDPPELNLLMVDVTMLAEHIDARIDELRSAILDCRWDVRELRREVRNLYIRGFQ